jgi:hypothetical protein
MIAVIGGSGNSGWLIAPVGVRRSILFPPEIIKPYRRLTLTLWSQ